MRNLLCKLFLLFSIFALHSYGQPNKLSIIPAPNHIVANEGHFKLTTTSTLSAKGKEAQGVLTYLRNKLYTATGSKLPTAKAASKADILLEISPEVKGEEAYTLQVTPHRIKAKASTAKGLFYAVQSLLQLMPPTVESTSPVPLSHWEIPAVEITDAPRFVWRGIMLDPCRHFIPADAVKKHIDVLASYKINRVHWHLTDDQGWRIEIKKYPKLTETGSKRTEGDGSVHQGFYTQEEIKEIVEYARERHIDIVPELEIPGHELAAISAYPELSCQGDSTSPRIIWGVEDIVMCPGKEKMFDFLQDVIDEMVPLFPSAYFHIGGDECPRKAWEKCPLCQARMKDLGYEKEAQLQSYIIGRIGKYLAQKGKRIIGWDEILEGGNLDTTAIVMSWRGEEGGITAAKAGHQVLMTPAGHGLYFDYYQGDPINEPRAFGGDSRIEKVYNYDPVPAEVHQAGRDRMVLGLQGNCWSEYIYNSRTLEYRLYPRALALAEVGWTQPAQKDFKDFLRRLDGEGALRLQARHLNFHIPMPEQPDLSCNNQAFVTTDTLVFKASRPLPIVYTTDGTSPTPSSSRYTSPLVIDRTTTIHAACLLPCGILSPVRTIYAEKTTYAPGRKLERCAPGLLLSKWDGKILRASQIQGEPAFRDSVITKIPAIQRLTAVPSNVRNVQDYAAKVEGYIDIPQTGVYEFSSVLNQVLIDGKMAIDNTCEPLTRFSPNNRQIALQKGLHSFSAIFIGGIFGGWPTYWDDVNVYYRLKGEKWRPISPEMLFH